MNTQTGKKLNCAQVQLSGERLNSCFLAKEHIQLLPSLVLFLHIPATNHLIQQPGPLHSLGDGPVLRSGTPWTGLLGTLRAPAAPGSVLGVGLRLSHCQKVLQSWHKVSQGSVISSLHNCLGYLHNGFCWKPFLFPCSFNLNVVTTSNFRLLFYGKLSSNCILRSIQAEDTQGQPKSLEHVIRLFTVSAFSLPRAFISTLSGCLLIFP